LLAAAERQQMALNDCQGNALSSPERRLAQHPLMTVLSKAEPLVDFSLVSIKKHDSRGSVVEM
jgi:hypothetical protein